ncbi:uncharacterized protein FSUBG_2920 [Fusarium subglutinans]|uniref:Uncharacterized protein n=1 Tax=Gibberella subglutinans TaxID=42677 RepID=A0A8H5Q8N1_GIBSU|nr:uncharacterized protein FSUBG_2920 [Fusarium subglutinans]KAF5610659.1 hypothetical protein FSUBG_2920 [Fusarium subglutinans]
MANEPDESSASTVNGSSSTAMYAIFNNVLQCHQRSKPEVDGRYFVTLLLEPRLFEDFRPLLDHLFHHYDYNISGGIITTRMAPNTNIHDDYATELGLLFRKLIDDFLNMEPYYARISAYQSRQSKVSEHGRRWEHLGGMRVRLKDPLAKKPGLVFLVGYSQNEDTLEKIAKDYIVETKGAVTSMFQHSDGKPVIGDKLLELRLADILMEKDTDECPLRPICFYLHQLSFFLDMAKA